MNRTWFVALLVVCCVGFPGLLFSQEEDTSNADSNYSLGQYSPTGGPTEVYVYNSTGDKNSTDRFKNSFGKFVIGPGKADGTAAYWWKGKGPVSDPTKQHNDTLKYLGTVTVKDSRPDTPANVDGWLYEATDSSGDKWWIIFGQDTLNVANLPGRFPVYYSFTQPDLNNLDNAKFQRWLTRSGTSRL